MIDEMQMLGRQNSVCGMHVHVEMPRPEDRVDLMNRLLLFTPLLLALSASFPFWQGDRNGSDRHCAAHNFRNLWQAQRDGVRTNLINGKRGELVPFLTQLDAVIGIVAQDADTLGCAPVLERAREIVATGKSADRQRAAFAEAHAQTSDDFPALKAFVGWIATTSG